MSVLDGNNVSVWSQWAGDFADSNSWTDPGERQAVLSLADEVRGRAILDVGVGAGRSVGLLTLLSADYRALDYTPAMVDLCRANHPGIDVRVGDARNLDFVDEASVDLVVFSFNGLDAVDHAGRLQALREFHRVLRPGGLLLFSGLNKDGRSWRQAPWQMPSWDDKPPLYRAVRFAVKAPRQAHHYWASYNNWWHLRRMTEDHGSWGMCPLSEHEFGLVVHFSTVPGQLRELRATGFDPSAIWAWDGSPIALGEASTAPYHHFVARRV